MKESAIAHLKARKSFFLSVITLRLILLWFFTCIPVRVMNMQPTVVLVYLKGYSAFFLGN